jgi:uncharacterized protein YecT (DUF1311 family)
MRTPLSWLLLIVFIHLAALNVLPQKRAKADPCPNALTQSEMTQCANRKYRTADATLNKVYAQLVSILNDEEKAQLKEVQDIWIKYRDANCNFVADQFRGGTMRPTVLGFCLAEVTEQRTADLRIQFKERNL